LRCGGSEEELTAVLRKLASYALSREVVLATELLPTLACLCNTNVHVAQMAARLAGRLADLLLAPAAGTGDAAVEVRTGGGCCSVASTMSA
jgi:hypothetical protein